MKLASIVSTMVLLLVLSGCRKVPEDISQAPYPSELRTKVELLRKRDDKGGRVRVVLLNEDKTKVTGAEVEYENGVTEFEEYRADGTLREITGYYPLAESASVKRSPSRSVLYDKDGKTVLFERTLRKDGTTESLDRSRADGGFETEIFYPDGKTTQTRKVVSSSSEVLLEETFRADGSLEVQRRKLTYGDSEVVEFRQNGTRLSATTRGSNRWDPIDKVVFGADGIMIEMKIHYTSYSVDVEYRREDGTVAEKRSYTSYGSVTVTVCGADGKPQYRQEWHGSSGDDWTNTTDYKLRGIEELKPDGSVVRSIELYDDGVTVKTTTVKDGVNYFSGTYRYYRPDGTLEKQEIKEDYQKVKETKDFKQEEGIKEKLPDDYFKLSKRPQPKMLSDMPIEKPYNQYGEGYPFSGFDQHGVPIYPNGYPGGYPYGYPNGDPNGYPNGYPNVNPNGDPNGNPNGNPDDGNPDGNPDD